VRRLTLSEPQAQLIRLLLREDRRQRLAAQQRLAECRRDLRAALAPPAPDPVAVLELSVEERLLQDRQAACSSQLELRVAALLRPDAVVEIRTQALN
jgi:hypothetical protein